MSEEAGVTYFIPSNIPGTYDVSDLLGETTNYQFPVDTCQIPTTHNNSSISEIAVSTSHKNYQFPTDTCQIGTSNINIHTLTDTYTLKLNKFVTLESSVNLGFDILGHWLDEKSLRLLFDNTPNYMKDIHEDKELPPLEEPPC